ncbi:MAG: PspC domain-containing protein [Bacteroidales bacterium]|nr:PspC domain-containing protein [Bacteroidales bacterium]
MGTTKKLYRNQNNKVIGGVASGLADYFEVDVVIFRLIFVLLALVGGGGVLGYIILWIVVPSNPQQHQYHYANTGASEQTQQNADTSEKKSSDDNLTSTEVEKHPGNGGLTAGIILIFFGLFFLATRMVPWFRFHDFWPLLLIIGGVFIIEPNLLKSKK